MQFACLTQIVVRFAVQHFVCCFPSSPFPLLSLELLASLSFNNCVLGQKEEEVGEEVGEEEDRVTGQAVVLVQDNNEALLSLSLSLVFSHFLLLSPHYGCFCLSLLFATGCIFFAQLLATSSQPPRTSSSSASASACVSICIRSFA